MLSSNRQSTAQIETLCKVRTPSGKDAAKVRHSAVASERRALSSHDLALELASNW